ncbi:hypothetical protein BJX99DRAFT_255414 [Aspergillus californicus]
MVLAFAPEYQAIFTNPAAPSLAVGGVVVPEFPGAVTSIWYIVKLIRAKPSLFPRSGIEETLELYPKDLFHGWKLLAFFWKQVTANKISKNPQKTATLLGDRVLRTSSGHNVLRRRPRLICKDCDAESLSTWLMKLTSYVVEEIPPGGQVKNPCLQARLCNKFFKHHLTHILRTSERPEQEEFLWDKVMRPRR